MRTAHAPLAMLLLLLSLPAAAASLIYVPPPPQLPETELEDDGTPKKPVPVERASRGQLLYENHCTACHESVAAIRVNRRVKSLAELRSEVVRWADYARLNWRQEDIDEVVRHLDSRHYRF